jgi:hypothetical protein
MDFPEAPKPCPFTSPPLVSLVSAAAYHSIIRDKSTEQYTLRAIMTEEASACFASEFEAQDINRLPKEYHNYADVFSEKEAYNLAPHQDFNLKIETIDGAEPLIRHVYSLSEKELVALQEFIDNNLRAGFIYPSSSTH